MYAGFADFVGGASNEVIKKDVLETVGQIQVCTVLTSDRMDLSDLTFTIEAVPNSARCECSVFSHLL